jgi:hypothetical protein
MVDSLVRRVVPVPRFTYSWIRWVPVNREGNHGFIVPRSSLFIGIRIVVEVGGKVQEASRVRTYHFKSMPIISRHFNKLEIVPGGDDFG